MDARAANRPPSAARRYCATQVSATSFTCTPARFGFRLMVSSASAGEPCAASTAAMSACRLRLELLHLRLDGGDVLLRSPHVLRLLHRAAHAARRGRRAPERGGAERLASEHRAEDGRRQRNSRLHPRARDLLLLARNAPAPPCAAAPPAPASSARTSASAPATCSSRASRAACCRRTRKSRSFSPGFDTTPSDGLRSSSSALLALVSQAVKPLRPFGVIPAASARPRAARLERRTRRRLLRQIVQRKVCFRGIRPVDGNRPVDDWGHHQHGPHFVHGTLCVGEAHVCRPEEHRA